MSSKKTIEPEVKKEIVVEIITDGDISITRVCRLVSIHRLYFYYTENEDNNELIDYIREASEFGDGFRKIYSRLRREGKKSNHKRVYRVYKLMRFNKCSKLKEQLPARVKQLLVTHGLPNQTWSIDFVSNSLKCGRKFRVLNILDDFDRSALAQDIYLNTDRACYKNIGESNMV